MQAAIQAHVDSAVSKTVNCPEDIAFEDFQDIYRAAYDTGLKGITTYRPNAVTGAVLEVKGRGRHQHQAELPLAAPPARSHDVYEAGGVVYMTQPLDRPEVLPGSTYKVRWPEADHAMYITINDIITDGRRRPFEVFINSKNMEHYAWTVALTRMLSAVFRRGGDVSFVVDELKAVFDPRGRRLGRRPLRALDPGRHRRGHRGAPDPHRLHRRSRKPRGRGRAVAARIGHGRGRRVRAPAHLPQVQPARAHTAGELRHLHLVRLFEVQLVPHHR